METQTRIVTLLTIIAAASAIMAVVMVLDLLSASTCGARRQPPCAVIVQNAPAPPQTCGTSLTPCWVRIDH